MNVSKKASNITDFCWNQFYTYIIEQWQKLDKTKLFKEQFTDKNIIIDELINEYNDHLILCHYNMYECDDLYNNANSIYREARSIVIDLNTEALVCCPFKKFFNIGELLGETDLNIVQRQIKQASLIEITNKLDGSMQQARWYNNHLIYTGSNSLNPEKSYQLKEGLSLFDDKYLSLCKDNFNYTFIFEAILNDDKHVVDYNNQNSLYLIGARNVYTGECLSYHEILKLGKLYSLPTVELENISFEQCLKEQSSFSAIEKEGWVIYLRIFDNIDNNYNEYRYKLKCDDYIKLHKIINSNIFSNNIIKAVADKTIDDIFSKLSGTYRIKVKALIDKIKLFVNFKTNLINSYYTSIFINLRKDIINVSKKEFALYVNKYIPKELRSYMFLLYNRKEFDLLKINTNSYITEKDIDNFLMKFSLINL